MLSEGRRPRRPTTGVLLSNTEDSCLFCDEFSRSSSPVAYVRMRHLMNHLVERHGFRLDPRGPDREHSVRWVRADVDDEQSVARAMEGADVAYYLVHSLGRAGFEERERRSADGFARTAETSGLRQIVYLGGLGDHADDLSPHLRSRRETEERLAASSVPLTTLRAGMVVGKSSAARRRSGRPTMLVGPRS
jgi:uncharacterized protein YbjT (DUF2867 family)